MCDPLEILNQKFQTKIWGKSGSFWKRNCNFSIGRRVKIKKTLYLYFCSLQLFYLHLSFRSKVKVTFCDPGTFKLKFDNERTDLGNFRDSQNIYQHVLH